MERDESIFKKRHNERIKFSFINASSFKADNPQRKLGVALEQRLHWETHYFKSKIDDSPVQNYKRGNA
jgi:hypothetical protein